MIDSLIAASVIAMAGAAGPSSHTDCRVVHGRLDLWNGGTPVKIWVVGTHRMLGVIAGPAGAGLPSEVEERFKDADDRWNVSIYGDYRVCALTPSRPGHLQMVRLMGARKLRVVPRTS